MNKSYHAIPTISLVNHADYLQPPVLPEVIHVSDPALSVLVDFKFQHPPIIAANKSLDDAKAEMQLRHLPLLLVIDEEKRVLGIITSEDILGEKPVKFSQERRIQRNEIEVSMIMTPCKDLIALDVHDLLHAKVGHIIQTLRETKQHTLIVVKIAANTGSRQQTIRGLFSASLISKQMDKDITLVLSEAQSVAELQHDLHH